MCFPIFLALIVIPIAELWLLIEIGGHLGGLETVALVVATAALGLMAARGLGIAAIDRLRRDAARLNAGQPGAPGPLTPRGDHEILMGPLLMVAALLLMFPGLITDALGLLLLLKPLRAALARAIARRMTAHASDPTVIVIRPRDP